MAAQLVGRALAHGGQFIQRRTRVNDNLILPMRRRRVVKSANLLAVGANYRGTGLRRDSASLEGGRLDSPVA